MVQILREQARQYVSDQSDAIYEQQNAQEFKEFFGAAGKLFGAMGGIAADIEAQNLKDKEEADTNMINTQIGSKAQTELLKWNVQQIESGVNPNTDEYTQKLYAKRDELYQPYLEQMESEKGRNLLQKQGLDAAERIRQSNIGQIAKNKKKAQAQNAFLSTARNISNDAREFGRLGDWDGFQEATKDDRSALVKYAKAHGNPAMAEFAVDFSNIQNYLLGLSESDPETVVTMFDDKETLRKIVYNELEKTDPNLTEKQKEKAFNKLYEQSGQKASGDEQLQAILPDKVLDTYTKHFVMAKKEELLDIKDRMKGLPRDSKAYKSLQSKLDEIQEQIDNPNESALSMLRSDLGKTVLPVAREHIGRNMLAQKQLEKETEIHTYRAVLNPDTSISFPAQMALSLGKNQTEEMYQMSFPDEDIKKSYDAYAQAKVETLTREYETIEGTNAMIDAYRRVLEHDPADQLGAIKEAFDGYVALHNAPVTQKQIDNYQNAMYAALEDGAFADLMRSYLSLKDRYTPDTSWFENAVGRADAPALRTVSPSPLILDPSNIDFYSRSQEEQDKLRNYDEAVRNMPEGVRLEEQGLVSPAIMAQDIDTVRKYFKNKVVEITNNAGGMFALAASQKDPEARRVLGQKAIDYYTNEKRKAFDYAMQNFGIDIAKLREVYNTRGEAITQLGQKRVKYVGDDPSTGLPNWEDYVDEKADKDARDRVLNSMKVL